LIGAGSGEVTKVELDFYLREERVKMRRFILEAYEDYGATLIRNYAPPGIGKSHLTVEMIQKHQEEDFVIVIPNHEMATGFGDLEYMLNQKGLSWLHVYGKTQPHPIEEKFCIRDKGEEYYTGCSFEFDFGEYGRIHDEYGDSYDYDFENCIAKCAYRRMCPYKEQFRNLDSYQVIICVFEHAHMFSDRVLVLDESFEQKMLKTITLLPEEAAAYNISMGEKRDFESNGRSYTFFDSVFPLFPLQITSQRSYFIAAFFDNCENISAYITDKDKICLFGRRIGYMPDYTRIIFNCATTPIRLMENITNTEFVSVLEPHEGGWFVYTSDEFHVDKLLNPMIKFKHNWGKRFSQNWLTMAIQYFKMFTEEIMIVTKKAMEEEFSGKFPEANFVHFNAGRGFNSMDRPEGYDVLIQYGRFGFTPLNQEMFRCIGFSDELIKDMEQSEMLQCLHRGRPLLHPNMPIILMSDRELFPNLKPISITLFDLFYKHYDIDLDQSQKELARQLGITRRDKVREFGKFVDFIRTHIYKLREEPIYGV